MKVQNLIWFNFYYSVSNANIGFHMNILRCTVVLTFHVSSITFDDFKRFLTNLFAYYLKTWHVTASWDFHPLAFGTQARASFLAAAAPAGCFWGGSPAIRHSACWLPLPWFRCLPLFDSRRQPAELASAFLCCGWPWISRGIHWGCSIRGVSLTITGSGLLSPGSDFPWDSLGRGASQGTVCLSPVYFFQWDKCSCLLSLVCKW